MIMFSRGQKGKLADLGCGSVFPVEVDIQAPGLSVDVSCFGLDASDRLSDDRYMVFYNQLASPEGAVRLEMAGSSARFAVNLDLLPASIAKLVFVAAIDGSQSMRSLGACALNLGSAVRFPWSGADFGDEKAVIVAELYRRDGSWRFGAVGQGFNGGLSALLAHFGGAEATPAAAPASTPTPAAPPAAKVSLSKVTLDKRGDKVSLDKRAGKGFGRIHVNLNWNQSATAAPPPPAKTGFFDKLIAGASPRKGRGGIDLDLGCMYELADGRRGLVQALGNSWGDLDREPFIKLDADDRTGAASGGENLYINGERFDQIRRALIFSFIYEGVPNWSATDGVVTIAVPDQAPIEVRLDGGGNQIMCAIALIENKGGSLQVTKLAEYFQQQGSTSAHELMDRHFGFGMRWKTGSK
ncbi:TerD family protein [Massilia yuzhufengensis]|uniref:Tellurite resistance protein TerA n=1 Tax=Massilia yuzhufengensis TaxID=1164594 RepID=A0A1I1W592_9BURK|nr:TerD family protein [Massilia yuzhufengensis]SFD90169.1 tellurite resistance protein TerA [Massilia yuzhufengensis]